MRNTNDFIDVFDYHRMQVKLELTEVVLDQMLNEMVEILSHVEYSRKRPDLYAFKSIYRCEEIPLLDFQ